jgi:hypothetical protein
VRLVGEDGILEASAARQTVQKITSRSTEEMVVPSSAPYPIFLDFVRNLSQPRIADEDIGFHLTEACLAANRSLADGAVRRIDPERWRFA